VIWFSSDWHLFHMTKRSGGVIKLSKRPFRDLDHMHGEIIRRAKEKLKRGDTLVLVGDITFGNTGETRRLLQQLKDHGVTLVCVRGNHDPEYLTLMNMGFDLVVDRMEIVVRGKRVVVSHYPFRPGLLKRIGHWTKGIKLKYMERREVDDGVYLLHGHTHSQKKLEGRRLHVGVDAWDFYPVPMTAIEGHIDRRKVVIGKQKSAGGTL